MWRDCSRPEVVVRALGMLLVCTVASAFMGWKMLTRWLDRPLQITEPVIAELPAGGNLIRFVQELGERGVLDLPNWLRLQARLTGVADKVRAGEYRFETGMTPRELLAMLVAGTAAGLQWTSSPFCYGAGNPSPAAWPSGPEAVTADLWLSTARPPTFTGSESASERTAKQRRLWQMAASGWLDPVWRAKFKAIKRDCFVKMNLRDIRIVLRVAHELNLKGTGGGWGETSMQRSHGIGVLDDPAQDPYIVREALRRYIRRFLDVFGAVQPDIPGDFAYGANQLWPYWCPVPEQFHPFDVSLACPPNARLVGPDVYDFWPPTFTQAEFDAKAAATSKQGWPKGMAAWADWAVAHGRLLAIGEFGLVSWTKNPDGSRPYFEGWDNPAFINLMLDFFQANAARLAFACYFNRDYAAAADMPASYIAPWAGLEDAATACERQPVGDNNRCGARAWRNRLAR